MVNEVKIEESWKRELSETFQKPYFTGLIHFLRKEKADKQIIYPPGSYIFSAFLNTPFHKVKVVIIGQDPYHGEGQANGLCFSVAKGVSIPPSLRNIFKELHDDLGYAIPGHGDLSAWAQQGVLLLNAVLTVRAAQPASHQGKGWEQFTDEVISLLSRKKENLVFLLWGSFARSKKSLISNHHFILEAAHPSPLSAHSGFLGCKHFSKANAFLKSKGIEPVNWNPNP